jgi:hypothetical protein
MTGHNLHREQIGVGRMEGDARLFSIASIDKTGGALIDATSLDAVARLLKQNRIPGGDFEEFVLNRSGMNLANGIQTLVLHENVYADSILFDRNDSIDIAEEMFPDIVRRLFIPPRDRHEIAITIEGMTDTWPEFYRPFDREQQELFYFETAPDKRLLDDLSKTAAVTGLPLDLVEDEELQKDALEFDSVRFPLVVLNSSADVHRAHYYLMVAKRRDYVWQPVHLARAILRACLRTWERFWSVILQLSCCKCLMRCSSIAN